MNRSSLKKYLVGFIIVIVFALYFIFVKSPSSQSPTTEPVTQATSTDTTTSTSDPISAAAQGLSFGSQGAQVSALQQILINEGYLTAVSAPTGYFGPLTQAALAEAEGTAPTQTAGQYKDGTYTGSVADAFYGNLQVAAVIQGGMITDVQFLEAPHGGHSTEVSNFAEPALKQEAITAQSANVNTVSGATQDSVAFNQSLAAALAQAKN